MIPRLRGWGRIAILAAAVLVAGCSSARLGEAAKLLADIEAGSGPSALKEATPPPERRPVRFETAGHLYSGDLYTPGGGQAVLAAMVLVPGVAPAGKDDPRLVTFAETLARARFRVLVPDVENLRALRVRPEDARAIADASAWLRRESPAGQALGVTAISYAVGPAVASLFEDSGGRVDFVIAVGGYYDLTAVVTFFTTGRFREGVGQPWRYRQPNAYGKWVFVESNLDRIASSEDRARLRLIKEMRLRDPAADVATWAAELGAEGQAVYALLDNDDPERVPAIVEALPEALLADFRALDLSRRDLSGLSGRFFLLHGRNDPIIPETESLKLAAALPARAAELYVVDSLDHVEPKPIGPLDRLILLRAAYAVLGMRGRP
ncbi:MAG: alpha/beta hydrolase [Rhodospirillales bacterium]|nr:alpha/beta hydrolase [Rhodospirillales bacterium]